MTAPAETTGTNFGLRPRERVIRRLAAEGMSDQDIAWRFRCSPGHIQRTLDLIEIPRARATRGASSTPTPIERTVMNARRRGATHAEIGARLRRSPGFIARIEQFPDLRERVAAG